MSPFDKIKKSIKTGGESENKTSAKTEKDGLSQSTAFSFSRKELFKGKAKDQQPSKEENPQKSEKKSIFDRAGFSLNKQKPDNTTGSANKESNNEKKSFGSSFFGKNEKKQTESGASEAKNTDSNQRKDSFFGKIKNQASNSNSSSLKSEVTNAVNSSTSGQEIYGLNLAKFDDSRSNYKLGKPNVDEAYQKSRNEQDTFNKLELLKSAESNDHQWAYVDLTMYYLAKSLDPKTSENQKNELDKMLFLRLSKCCGNSLKESRFIGAYMLFKRAEGKDDFAYYTLQELAREGYRDAWEFIENNPK